MVKDISTYCGLVISYGVITFLQHWFFVQWIFAWYQDIPWSDCVTVDCGRFQRNSDASCDMCFKLTLQWRHNGRDSISNHQPHDCLLSRLFRRRSKKTSKFRVTGLCAGILPGTGEFPAQWPVTRKMFPFHDVIMKWQYLTVDAQFTDPYVRHQVSLC